MTYQEFDEHYKQAVQNFIDDLNNRFKLKLTKRDFDDHFYKMESTVIYDVDIEEDE